MRDLAAGATGRLEPLLSVPGARVGHERWRTLEVSSSPNRWIAGGINARTESTSDEKGSLMFLPDAWLSESRGSKGVLVLVCQASTWAAVGVSRRVVESIILACSCQ